MAGSGPSLGQEAFPAKPIRLVVGFTPGTATDLVARQIVEGIKRNTGWVMYVDNKPGQGGSIGARELVRSAPDGYTLLVTANGPLITNPNLYSNVEYDTLRDFTPIGQIATLPYVMVVNSTKPLQFRTGRRCRRKEGPGQAEFFEHRHWHDVTPDRRDVFQEHRRGGDAYPVQGQRGVDDRSSGREHRLHVRYVGCDHPSRQGRSAESAGRRFKAKDTCIA